MQAAPFVLVLGMHRSGTSCLAGALERCGVYLGEVARSDKHNAKGNLELDAARLLDDRILESCGGAWDAPPARVEVSAGQREAMDAVVRELALRRPCGLKDPRMLLLLPEWLRAVGPSAFPVGTYRHPTAVARSLQRRNGFDVRRSAALWARYNTALVEAHRARPFPIMSFELRDPAAYCETVARLAEAHGLQPDRARMLDFVSAELDHTPDAGGEVPDECRPLWEYLESVREPWARPAAAAQARRADGRTRLQFVCGAVAAGKSAWIARHSGPGDAAMLPDKGAVAALQPGGSYLVHYNLLRPWAKLRSPEGARWSTAARQVRRRLQSAVNSPFAIDRRLRELLDAPAEKEAVVLVAPREVLLARLAARRATASAEALAADDEWRAVLMDTDLAEACRECVRYLRARGLPVKVVDATDPAWPPVPDEGSALDRLAS